MPFPDSNAVWNVCHDYGRASINVIGTINGDSLYNGYLYKKHYESTDTNGITAPYLAALVRQDIPSKKVFAIYAGTSSEILLYNFGLNVNDTVTVNWSPENLKVIAKDSVLINGQYRKRLRLTVSNLISQGYDLDNWIEGIGSMYGVFNSGYNGVQATDIHSPLLICFTKNGIKEYATTSPYTSPRCFVRFPSGVGIEKYRLQNSLLKIYPNPSNGILNIEVNTATLEKPLSIIITDALGRIVKQVSLSVSTKIDLSDVKEGIYFLQVWEGGRLVATEKVVRE